MTSPLVTVRNTIATIWEAVTPPTDTAITYHQIDGREIPSGASARRCFWFPPPEGGVQTEMARTLSVMRHEFTARVRLVLSGLSTQTQFADVVNEAVLLINAINRPTSWSTGIDFVQANSYRVDDDVPKGSIDLVISIVAECQEAD